MDDIEFKPYESENLKRIGTKNDADGNTNEKRPFNKNNFKPKNYTLLILLLLIIVAIVSYKYYEKNVLYPNQTKSELLEIRSALYLYKESFNSYPTQMTELTKSRPLRDNWLTDAWGNPYRYEVDESKQGFLLTSVGIDGEFSTNDDIQIK